MKKILFIDPQGHGETEFTGYRKIQPHIGLAYLAGVAEKLNNMEIKVLDCAYYSDNEISTKIKTRRFTDSPLSYSTNQIFRGIGYQSGKASIG